MEYGVPCTRLDCSVDLASLRRAMDRALSKIEAISDPRHDSEHVDFDRAVAEFKGIGNFIEAA